MKTLLGICFWRGAPEIAVGASRPAGRCLGDGWRAGKRGSRGIEKFRPLRLGDGEARGIELPALADAFIGHRLHSPAAGRGPGERDQLLRLHRRQWEGDFPNALDLNRQLSSDRPAGPPGRLVFQIEQQVAQGIEVVLQRVPVAGFDRRGDLRQTRAHRGGIGLRHPALQQLGRPPAQALGRR